MKVLKFGGTSVGSPESLLKVKEIVEAEREAVVVVVSALGGVTDLLLGAAEDASRGRQTDRKLEEIVLRHMEMIEKVIPSDRRPTVREKVDTQLTELQSILKGVYLIQDLTQKTSDAIVAYGERLSSVIVAGLLQCQHVDSRELIKTTRQGKKHIVDFETTNVALRKTFSDLSAGNPVVMGGFIAADRDLQITTNLGRGGSDYTAAIVAAALDADALEIWTDVDGFMTADPRIIPSAYTIDCLSYNEAMELCNFGAKVIYSPTIYPVCTKNIPIYVKNTFNAAARGSVITTPENVLAANIAENRSTPIRGISSINEMSIVTVSGPTMVGVIGVNRRIFACLAAKGISVFMVVQTSSETSTSLCMTPADARKACEVLDHEFSAEIEAGAMNTAQLREGLSTVAVVGENMKQTPGIAGKLFSVLGRNGISVYAIGQGSLEQNISFVVERSLLRKSLNVLHNSFFLSEFQEVNLFVCGTGTVGSSLLRQIASQRSTLMQERRLKINLVGVCGTKNAAYNREGIDPAAYREAMEGGVEGGIERMVKEILEMNIFNSVFVDCTASESVAQQYPTLLAHNVNIVAANKVAASSDFPHYNLLKETARKRGVHFLFETNVGAGLPIINTINDLRASGDEILRIEAVVSGTLNFIFSTLAADQPLSRVVRMAKEEGYSEPDPRIDLIGKDVLRKLVILARESGYFVNMEDVAQELFIPDELFKGSLEEFWEKLPALDAAFEDRRLRLEKEGKRLRFVATWEADASAPASHQRSGRGSIGLKEVDASHPFYNLQGTNNIISLTTARYKDPMLIQGYGAGADVTAAGVFADIMRCANS